MIIVSQDKEKIVNFDNVNIILVRENKIISFDNTYTDNQDGDLLGKYKTEERAKEVLQEIGDCYKSIQMLKFPNYKISTKITGKDLQQLIVYKMPEK